MTFKIRMGVPEMAAFYKKFDEKAQEGKLDADERRFFKKLTKSLRFLSHDPSHPGLRTHPINELTQKYGHKVFQSYLSQGDKAERIYWAYGPNRKEITILGIEPHPESSNRGAYKRISLSDMPKD